MLLAVENVTHHYGALRALSSLSLHLNRREILGLLGPNGSGKSTLLRLVATLTKPQSGRVEVCGFDTARHPQAVRARIGVVLQTQTLDQLLTVEENLLATGAFQGLGGRALHERVRHTLAQLHLTDRRHNLARNLSGGLQRRAEIARALLHEPQLLILDEPTTGLDPVARDDFWAAIEDLRASRQTAILLSTHLFEEAERCDSLLLLHEGQRVAEGSPAELTATIGGELIEIRARQPEMALARLQEIFPQPMRLSDGAIWIEAAEAHRLVPRLVDALPGEVISLAFHQPGLADVFRKLTAPAALAVAQ